MENPVVSCSRSCSALISRKRKSEKQPEISFFDDESYVYDDIIMEILSRLSTKQVLRSQCVCRRWRNLTSTRDFTNLHIKRCFPMILKKDKTQVISFWEPTRVRSKIYKVYEPYHKGIILSHNGLILAHGDGGVTNFIIYNPIYSDVVNITVPPDRTALGVFFHPVQKEYCSLWRIIQFHEPRKIEYKILNLESNPMWRDITNPYAQHIKNWSVSDVLIGDYIYWMCEPYQDASNCDIMQYDTRNEEFRLISCPIPIVNQRNVNLIDIDGVVSLVQVLPSKELTIWTLKDEGDQLWTSSNYIIRFDISPGYLKALAFWNGELVIQSDERLYVCNTKLGTCGNFRQKYGLSVGYMSHTTSLVSLRNCRSEICMVEED